MKKTLATLVALPVLSLGLVACNNGGGSTDCDGASPSGVTVMSLVDGKSGGGRGGSRSGGGKSSSGKSGGKPGSSKPKKHKSHDFDNNCDD